MTDPEDLSCLHEGSASPPPPSRAPVPAPPPPPEFYASLDADLVFSLRSAADEIRRLERKSTEAMLEIGRQLAAVRTALQASAQPRAWTDWLSVEFGMDERTARRFVAAHERFGDRPGNLSALPASAVVMLAHAPDFVVENVVRQVEDGARLGVKDVAAFVKAAKPPVVKSPPPDTFLRTPSADQEACSCAVHDVMTRAGATVEVAKEVTLTIYRLADGRSVAVTDSDKFGDDAFGIWTELAPPEPKTMPAKLREFIRTKQEA